MKLLCVNTFFFYKVELTIASALWVCCEELVKTYVLVSKHLINVNFTILILKKAFLYPTYLWKDIKPFPVGSTWLCESLLSRYN